MRRIVVMSVEWAKTVTESVKAGWWREKGWWSEEWPLGVYAGAGRAIG
jgi:hypothetical protein